MKKIERYRRTKQQSNTITDAEHKRRKRRRKEETTSSESRFHFFSISRSLDELDGLMIELLSELERCSTIDDLQIDEDEADD